MTPSKTLFYLCLSFVIGIGLESILDIPQFVLWIFLFSASILIFIFVVNLLFQCSQEHWNSLLVVGFCILLLIFGVLRLQIAEFNIANDKLSRFNDSGKNITLTGTVAKEAEFKESSQKIKVEVQQLIIGNQQLTISGTVLVTTDRYPEYQYLEEVKITGKIQTPMETEEFSYKNYLLKDHIYSVMYFPKIDKLDRGRASLFSYGYSGILLLKRKMRESIQSNFLPPHSSILEGVILGDKNAISQEIKDKFRITGLSHIIAISGLHIVILSSIVMHFLLFLGIGRGKSFYIVSLFIVIYIILAGMPSSAVRAGIMGIVYLLSQKLGRQSTSSRLIVLAAASILLFNPLLLFYDVGFQLSFLAVLGIILLEPIIRFFIKFLMHKFLNIKTKPKYENILSLLTVTVSAQVFTMPIIIYNFGNVSLVSLFTNILILPAMPAIMLFGFLSALAGAVFNFLAWMLSLPGYFLLMYVFLVVDVFSKPWAYKIILNVSWIWVAVCYIFLGVITRYFTRKLRQKFLDY